MNLTIPDMLANGKDEPDILIRKILEIIRNFIKKLQESSERLIKEETEQFQLTGESNQTIALDLVLILRQFEIS